MTPEKSSRHRAVHAANSKTAEERCKESPPGALQAVVEQQAAAVPKTQWEYPELQRKQMECEEKCHEMQTPTVGERRVAASTLTQSHDDRGATGVHEEPLRPAMEHDG